MQFQVENELFDTQDMLSLELDGIYLNVYCLPGRRMAFVQSFDEERGVMVRRADGMQTALILDYFLGPKLPDVNTYRRLLESLRYAKMPMPATLCQFSGRRTLADLSQRLTG